MTNILLFPLLLLLLVTDCYSIVLRLPTLRNLKWDHPISKSCAQHLPSHGRNLQGNSISSHSSRALLAKKSDGDNPQPLDRVPALLRTVVNEDSIRWGLTYADLRPYTDKDLVGITFLATNILYLFSGMVMFNYNQTVFSLILELAGIASIYYHWSQLHYGPGNSAAVRALLVDYAIATSTILFCFSQLLVVVFNGVVPYDVIGFSVLSFACLIASWLNEFGIPYMVWHGLWHVFSGYATIQLSEILHNIPLQ